MLININKQAKERLKGNWLIALMGVFIYFTILIIIERNVGKIFETNYPQGLRYINTILSIILIPLTYGLSVYFLNIIRGDMASIKDIFEGFKDIKRVFITQLIVNIEVAIFTLLLIVPGIIKLTSYSMTNFILKDNPSLKPKEVMQLSKEMTNGHKSDIFFIILGYLGETILLTLMGVALLIITMPIHVVGVIFGLLGMVLWVYIVIIICSVRFCAKLACMYDYLKFNNMYY